MNDIFYTMGNVDAIAKLFMHIRRQGVEKTLEDCAKQLIDLDKEHPNPHAVHYLKTVVK